jgi:branched-chain amino acid transport system substrate-binding protein
MFGEITGEKVKAALETWRDKEFPEKGILPPITFTPEDHRPHTKALVLTIENGKYKLERDWIDVGRPKKWLGW